MEIFQEQLAITRSIVYPPGFATWRVRETERTRKSIFTYPRSRPTMRENLPTRGYLCHCTHTHTYAHIIGDVYIGLRYTCVRAPADIHGFCLFAFAAVLSPTRASIKNTPRGGFVRALASCRPSIIIFACSARSARQISTALCVCTLAARVGCGSITLPRQRFCIYRTSSYSGADLVFFFRPSPFFCAPAGPLFFHGK